MHTYIVTRRTIHITLAQFSPHLLHPLTYPSPLYPKCTTQCRKLQVHSLIACSQRCAECQPQLSWLLQISRVIWGAEILHTVRYLRRKHLELLHVTNIARSGEKQNIVHCSLRTGPGLCPFGSSGRFGLGPIWTWARPDNVGQSLTLSGLA